MQTRVDGIRGTFERDSVASSAVAAPIGGRTAPDDAAADAALCRSIVLRHARTFSLASRLLPARKRRAAFAIYATCRIADDLVDVRREQGGTDLLNAFRSDALLGLDHGSHSPILRELSRAFRDFSIPRDALHELFEGVARDLDHTPPADWPALQPYCEGVASSVGEMVCAIFGLAPDADRGDGTRLARTMGVAMQLTNILRDVGEDARRGRCYLPSDELAGCGLSSDDLVAGKVDSKSNAWRNLMEFQVARARAKYREALSGIPMLEADSRRCALACAAGYARILDAIERNDFDTISRRVTATKTDFLVVLAESWLLRTPAFARGTFGTPPSPSAASR